VLDFLIYLSDVRGVKKGGFIIYKKIFLFTKKLTDVKALVD